MKHRRVVTGAAVLALSVSVVAAAVATGASAPSTTNIKAVQTLKVKINRYVQDGLRWDKDAYSVASGGTLHIVNNAPDEGPHTFTVVAPKDAPKTPGAVLNCKVCSKLGKAHGADPNSDAPPKFNFLENGVGQKTAPSVDKAGDSGLTGDKKGNSIDLKVTATAGTKLHFMCIIHPWMQGTVNVR